MEHKEEGAAAASVPAMPKSGHFADKENINPLFDQPKSCGQSGPGLYGIPPPKQQFARGASTGKGRMMRTPLADITALCMLQGALPPKQQQQANTGAAQKGLWGQAHLVQDKLGAGQAASGGASSSGHRLAAMR